MTRVSNSWGTSKNRRATGASLIASGRVPRTMAIFSGWTSSAPGPGPVASVWQELLVPVGDASLGQVVRRHFKGDAVAGQNAYAIAAKLTGQVGEHGAFLIQLHAEQAARKFLNNGSSDFNTVFFTHCPPTKIIAPRRKARYGRQG